MKRLEQLPEITNETLGGLVAGQEMKARILASAAAPRRRRPAARVWVPALCATLALVVGLSVGLPSLLATPSQQPLISSMPAGDGTVGNEQALLDLNGTNVNVGARGTAPDFRSIWENGSDGSFPMIGLKGRYYRMLTTPDSVSSTLLGSSLGSVENFTTEPALAGSDVVMSNRVAGGTEVYEISGMGGTLVAAQVDGVYRVFQRVSFNGGALLGRENLADTLQISGHILMMELSGVGTVTDSQTAEQLFATLTDKAQFESSGTVSGKQSLLIELDNGLTLQLLVKNDKLGACGVWSCPEFFEAFEAAVQ